MLPEYGLQEVIILAVCMFTGHRPKGLPFGYNERDSRCKKLKKMLKKLIVQKIQEENTTAFLSGMALGTDMFAAEIVLELKRKFGAIRIQINFRENVKVFPLNCRVIVRKPLHKDSTPLLLGADLLLKPLKNAFCRGY